MKFILSPTATVLGVALLATTACADTCTFEFYSSYIIYSVITSDQVMEPANTKIFNGAGALIGSTNTANINDWNTVDSQLPYTVDFYPDGCGPDLSAGGNNEYSCASIPFKYATDSFDMVNGPGCTWSPSNVPFNGEDAGWAATYTCPFAC